MSLRHALPDDFAGAYWATSQALHTGGWLLDHVNASLRPKTRPDMPEQGVNYLYNLAKWLEITKERVAPLEIFLCDAFDSPPKTSYGYSSCWFAAGIEVAERVLDAVWTAVDDDGYYTNTIRPDVIGDVWKSTLLEARAIIDGLERPEHFHRVMLFKEAVRASLRRDGALPIVEESPPSESSARCAQRDLKWCEWYLSESSGCTGSPTQVGNRWNKLSDIQRKEICPTAWQKVPRRSLKDTVRKAIDRVLRRQGLERPSAK